MNTPVQPNKNNAEIYLEEIRDLLEGILQKDACCGMDGYSYAVTFPKPPFGYDFLFDYGGNTVRAKSKYAEINDFAYTPEAFAGELSMFLKAVYGSFPGKQRVENIRVSVQETETDWWTYFSYNATQEISASDLVFIVNLNNYTPYSIIT